MAAAPNAYTDERTMRKSKCGAQTGRQTNEIALRCKSRSPYSLAHTKEFFHEHAAAAAADAAATVSLLCALTVGK